MLTAADFAQTGMAHVLYHRPKFAVFDGTSEHGSTQSIFTDSQKAGITLIMRLSLAKYHMLLLTLTGDGSARWTLTRMGTADRA
jgi:ATP-binding cassette subfamily D (ALD) long-chain fatty acid import protein